MARQDILTKIKELNRKVFTTREIAALCSGSVSNAVQALSCLVQKKILLKIKHGLWALDIEPGKISPYSIIPFLLPNQRVYVSFISALHLYGIIEQIPQAVTLASTAHTRTIKTVLGTFYCHRIAPSFFRGFDWYKKDGAFLIAEPEKALVDCLYLSARRKKQFSYFPELHIPKNFSFKKAGQWVEQIHDKNIRACARKKLKKFCKGYNKRV
jgi:predicted transcriptional regulator of viral defense system